jgi:hypothetical protein
MLRRNHTPNRRPFKISAQIPVSDQVTGEAVRLPFSQLYGRKAKTRLPYLGLRSHSRTGCDHLGDAARALHAEKVRGQARPAGAPGRRRHPGPQPGGQPAYVLANLLGVDVDASSISYLAGSSSANPAVLSAAATNGCARSTPSPPVLASTTTRTSRPLPATPLA